MRIQSLPPNPATCPPVASAAPKPPDPPIDQTGPSVNESLDFLSRVVAWSKIPVSGPAPLDVPAPHCIAPSERTWPSDEQVEAVLKNASTDVPEQVRSGADAINFDAETRQDITTIQTRQAQKEQSPVLERMVHRKQVHGGAAEIHWNPGLDKYLKLFGMDSSKALIRFSDASSEANPDGPAMYGMALEFEGRDGKANDILLTGGSEKTEVSQARDAEAQLALFNMINVPSKLKGLARIACDVGPVSGVKMLRDVKKMRSDIPSLTQLTAWSRAPFSLKGKDGKEYLVKMRAVPTEQKALLPGGGTTSSEKVAAEFKNQLRQGDVRWRLEFQFMQPGDDAYDGREAWNGPWLAAAEIVVPRIENEQESQRQADLAENTKFSVWKNKEDYATGEDRDVLRPWGEMNRARFAAYGASGSNRKCPLGYG